MRKEYKEPYGVWLGILMGMIIFSVIFSAFNVLTSISGLSDSIENYYQFVGSIIGFVATTYIAVLFYKRRKKFILHYTILNVIFSSSSIIASMGDLVVVIGTAIPLFLWTFYLYKGEKPKKVFIN